MSGPLAGLTVVDLSERSVPAALIGMLLSDYGATVYRVEPPAGDELRALPAYRVWTRGQHSVAGLNPEQVHELCASADVVIDTAQAWSTVETRYTPPVPPGQVYCLVTAEPFDVQRVAAGERPQQPVYGELAEANLGFMYIQDGHRGSPTYLGWPHASFGTAWMATAAILAAVHHRRTTGAGQVITTSLADGLASLNTQRWVGGGTPALEKWPAHSSMNRMGNSMMLISLFQCADGVYIQMNSGTPGATNRLFTLIGREDLIDPELEVRPHKPFPSQAVADQFWEEFPKIIRSRTSTEWMELLQPLDVSVMIVRPPGAALELDQPRRQGLVMEDGDEVQFGLAPAFSRSVPTLTTKAPAVGEHGALPTPSTPSSTVETSGGVGPLAGVTVLDLGHHIAGPFTSRILADLGARVIKVSERDAAVGPVLLGHSLGINRGKESVVLDLKTADGQNALRELVRRADVLQHNMRPKAMRNLGLSREEIAELNPRLIYCHSSGYGSKGPWSELPAWGPLIDATAGLLARTGGAGQPPMHYATHVDYGGAMNTVSVILAALCERDVSGRGQFIEHPQLGAAMFAMSDVYLDHGRRVETFGLDPAQRGHSPANAVYPIRDGWVLLTCYSQREWEAAHAALNVTPPASYADVRRVASDAWGTVADALGPALAAITADDAVARLRAAGVAATVPVPMPAEVLPGLDWTDSGLLVQYHDERFGDIFEIGTMARFAGTPIAHARPHAVFGEHTRPVLREIGWADEDVARALASGAALAGEPIKPPATVHDGPSVYKIGARLRSRTSKAEIVVVRVPSRPAVITCGGQPMVEVKDPAEALPADPDHGGQVLIGKRYADPDGDVEVLCTKAGEGALAIDGVRLDELGVKPLPSSD